MVGKSPNSKAPSYKQLVLPPENHTKNGSDNSELPNPRSLCALGLVDFKHLQLKNIRLDTKFNIFYITSILSFESSWSMRSHFSRFFFQ